MQEILTAATELVVLLSPRRVEALADRLRDLSPAEGKENLRQFVIKPTARAALERLIAAWRQQKIPGDVLAGILMGATLARQHAQRESSVELVWTGPTTPHVALRRTEQVLLDLINQAQSELFLVSFVAYDVSSIVNAVNPSSAFLTYTIS